MNKPDINLLQVTDTHLFADKNQQLLGINTFDSLSAVVKQIRQSEPCADLLLVTGDLVQDGSITAYQHLMQQTEGLADKQLWLAGNHDEATVMAAVPASQQYLQTSYALHDWQIILLSSHVQKRAYGQFSLAELQALEQQLQQSPAQHILLAMHHHCLSVGSAWIDKIKLHNSEQFLALCKKYPAIRGVISGHVHQASQQQHQGMLFLTAPSTCVQFQPTSEKFQVDQAQPGYQWLTLHPDGRISVRVERLTSASFQPNLQSAGY